MSRSHVEKVLSSYQHIGNLVYNHATSTSAADFHANLRYFLLEMPVVPILLACHSLAAALAIYSLTKGRQFWLKSLVLTTFAAFGGSTMANVLSAAPAPLFTVSSNYMMGYIFMAWYIVNHSVAVRYLFSFKVPKALLAFGATAAKVRSIMAFVDDFVIRFPTAVAGAVILGGLAGSGGSLFVNVERVFQSGLDTPSEFSRPGWGFKVSYLAAFVYYVGTDPVGWLADKLPFQIGKLDKGEMRFAVSMMLCTHAMLETLYGRHFNPLWGLERVAYAVTGVQGKEICEEKVVGERGEDMVEKDTEHTRLGLRKRKTKKRE